MAYTKATFSLRESRRLGKGRRLCPTHYLVGHATLCPTYVVSRIKDRHGLYESNIQFA